MYVSKANLLKWPLRKTLKAKDISTTTTRLARNASPVLSLGFLSANWKQTQAVCVTDSCPFDVSQNPIVHRKVDERRLTIIWNNVSVTRTNQ